MSKVYQKGDKYRPIVHIEKVKSGIPTVLKISGKRYVLEHRDQHYSNKKRSD